MNDIPECKVSLWIVGDTLNPDELAEWLGCAPAYQARKGDTYYTDEGEEMVASTGRFQLTTGWHTGKPLERLIGELLDRVPDDAALWDRINTSLSGDVFCGLIMGGANEETKLSTDTLQALACRGLSLHLDIYDSADGPIS
ncbi:MULTISPECIES: DUF4279 domain-containing protein [Sphingomonadales]|uniref:DUF4279 domain-containing protein n=1 Tax=Edaphosphingomonas haloaromaticamans TaxID=653954 RepID=A0A1S1HG90_9SPHN|nr:MULTISPECIES: DUF4279 domain-containing protein [Sphingomonas]AGH48810.1 hypothetical protein G432_05415 [Sphingomonas sp. MM-1]OHT21235.1 hypothetical protein BHE75_03241 [Sphingomonas haloaromaticamans]